MSRWYSSRFKVRTTRAMKKWGKLMWEDTTSKRMASGVKLVKRPLCGWVLRVNMPQLVKLAGGGFGVNGIGPRRVGALPELGMPYVWRGRYLLWL